MDEKEKAIDLYALDPDFRRGTGLFMFDNGDQYEGEYCAHRSGIVWREGTGTYMTRDGQLYAGEWRDDKLKEDKESSVSYPSGVTFNGKIVKNKYEGPGMYVLENQMSLLCEFKENKPSGNIILIDPKGKEWHGKADEEEALLLPEHVYFESIHEDLGKGRSRKLGNVSVNEVVSKNYQKLEQPKNLEYMNELKLKIFKKTQKTISDLKFEDSAWYTNFIQFKNIYDGISNKIEQHGVDALNEEEHLWYQKYKEFKKKYSAIIDARKNNRKKLSEYKLYELFNSEEYKSSCPAISVFYPTPAPHEHESEEDD